MADYLAAWMTIGGPIPRQAVALLCKALCDARLYHEESGDLFEPSSAEEVLAARTEVYGSLVVSLYDDEVAWGTFPELEAFLEEQRISYDRFHDEKYEIEPSLKQFRPDMGAFEFPANLKREIILPAAHVWAALPQLEQVRKEVAAGRMTAASQLLEATLGSLKENLPPQLPSLETLEIVG